VKNSGFFAPAGYDRISVVDSFEALVSSAFGPKVNAICWRRTLHGNFDELAAHFKDEKEVVSLDEMFIRNIWADLSPEGRMAAEQLLEDQRLLQRHGLSPSLECVARYQRDDMSEIIPTDVYSFHADRATVAADTYLCSYNEAATEGLRNDLAQRHVDVPSIRAKLLDLFQPEETGGDFETYLMENCYDLHYAATASASSFSFGIGNLWRVAIEYPGCPVPPCLHRAPEATPGKPRLLLIS
jgi:hypothetical protein